jgi:pyruvate ferredoxin oxidoreductase beta subunit
LLWELEGGDFNDIKINKKLPNRKPVVDYLKLQGRFKHIMKDEDALAKIQKMVDEECEQYGI